MADRLLTRNQRLWVIARDGNKCVICGANHDLQVHHIVSHRVINFVVTTPENPVLLATLYERCHSFNPDNDAACVHPDMSWARNQYRKGDHSAIQRVFDRRNKKMRREVVDKPIWNHQYDAYLLQHALYATLDYVKDHPWPTK